MSEILIQDTSIARRDRVHAGRGPSRAVLINSATAVPRKIYRGFATYLAEHGCAAVTYDCRGIGGSEAGYWRLFLAPENIASTRCCA